MSTYLIAYIFYFIICIFITFFVDYIKLSKMQTIGTLVILIIINSIIGAIRPIDTADTISYYTLFLNCEDIVRSFEYSGISSIFANRSYGSIELLYIIFVYCLKQLIGNYEIYFFVNSTITSILMVIGFWELISYLQPEKKSNDLYKILSAWVMYMFLSGILYSSVALRAGLSIGLGLCFLGLLLNKKKIAWAIICLIIAILFHTASISFVIIYIIIQFCNFNITKRKYIFLFASIIICYIARIGRFTVQFAIMIVNYIFTTLNINAFSSYFNNIDYALKKREGFLILCLGVVLLLIYMPKKRFQQLSLVVIVGMAISTFAYPISALSREIDMFIIMLVPMFAYAGNYCSKKYYSAIKVVSVLLIVPQYFMIFAYY